MPNRVCKKPLHSGSGSQYQNDQKLLINMCPEMIGLPLRHHYDLLLKFVFESGCLNFNAILYGADTVEKILVNLFQSVP